MSDVPEPADQPKANISEVHKVRLEEKRTGYRDLKNPALHLKTRDHGLYPIIASEVRSFAPDQEQS